MTQFIEQIINGLSIGSIYALLALGYTMVYGIIGLINFAHGEVYMLGSFIGFYTFTYLKIGFFPSVIVAMIATMIIGVLIERLAYRPLRKAKRISVLITAIGVSLLIQNLMIYFFSADPKSFVVHETSQFVKLGSISIKVEQIYIFVISIILMILLQFIVHKTKMGRAMRAVKVDKEAATLMGIDVDKTISFTFAIGSALAGAAGVLVGAYYVKITPMMGTLPGLKAFIAAVFGGIGLIPGAMIGGLSIGMIETMVGGYLSTTLKDGFVYALLIIILIIKPTGLLGKNRKEKV